MKKTGIILFILLSQLTMQAQQYSYKFTDGWTALLALSEDISVGLSANENFEHRILLQNENLYPEGIEFYPSSSSMGSIQSPFGIHKTVSGILISGIYKNIDTGYTSSIFEFDDSLKFIRKIDYQDEDINFSISTLRNGNNYYQFGQQRNNINAEQFDGYFAKFDSSGNQILSKTYSCGGKTIAGGCAVDARQMLQGENNTFYLCAIGRGHFIPYTSIKDGLIIKVDSTGKELWRLNIKNDSTSCHNLLIAPLANGNYLATWQDYYYKPYKSPSNNQYPEPNDESTIWFSEFSPDGVLIKTWNLKKILDYKFEEGFSHWAFHNHLIQTKDSGILIVGNTRQNIFSYVEIGYSLKLDKHSNYQWYRQYRPSVKKPHDFGQEKLFINGVTELSDGSFALAGEYRSSPSDSFPTGTQKGIVLFVDEFGCFEPGCQLTDNINELRAKKNTFKVYPNPTNGIISIETRGETKKTSLRALELFDMQGRMLHSENYTVPPNNLSLNLKTFELTAQVYYLKLLRDDGLFEVHRVVLQ
ncbi:MAG: hypothetical protein COA58_09690 [Bacteroidetes bacterium]|nr:MAG: hypothetical protein COA58_09690 [Bacteroidota bacterium]